MIRIGIIGLGAVGQIAHLASFKAVAGCDVVAVADLRPGLCDLVCRHYGVTKAYGTHHALLNDPEVDAVAVVVRRPATGPIVLDALAASKHVLCEKPMAHTAEQGRRLVDAAAAACRHLAVGFMKRYDPGVWAFTKTLSRLRQGCTLGRMLHVRTYSFAGNDGLVRGGFLMTDEERPDGLDLWPVAPSWVPASQAGDYASFLNVHSHMINLVNHLFGSLPTIVLAQRHRYANGLTAIVQWDDMDGVMEFGESKSNDWHEGIEVVFERGRLTLNLPMPLRPMAIGEVTLVTETETRRLAADGADWAFRAQAQGFVRAVKGGDAPLTTGAGSIEDLVFMEQLWSKGT
ncbi:putative dehydrogenase [Candidatus Terasakiella magnetica]|nr:putative dehydrogenase [Candidatus Terasakiella magnetica]